MKSNIDSSNLVQKLGRVLLVLTIAFLWFGHTDAQIFPVQSTTQLVPPYSVYLSDYATPGTEKLRVILLQRDLTQPSYQLRLMMRIEHNGKEIIRTARTFAPAPIDLNPGIPTVISGADLAPYLDSRNMDFTGYSREQYERTKSLPEGSYQITFTAYDYRRQDVQVSNVGTSFYYLSKSEPPYINFPACGTRIPMRNPQQLVFSWLARNTASPNSVAETQYELALYETRPEGRNPNDVVLSSPPVFKVTVDMPQYVYSPADPMLLEGMQYVWRVRAIDRNGKDAFRNNGYSEVCTFTYGGVDPNFDIGIAQKLQAEGETERRARIWWEAGAYDGYRVNYRKTGPPAGAPAKAGEGHEWFVANISTDELNQQTIEGSSTEASAQVGSSTRASTQIGSPTEAPAKVGEVKLFDLEPDTEYETRVQVKKDGFFGNYSEIVKFRTLPLRIAICGQNLALPAGDPTRPLYSAIKGMTITVEDTEVQLMEVLHLGEGWYKGTGRVGIDYLGGAVFPVMFERLFIDENRVAGFGRIDFVSEGVAALVEQQLTNVEFNNQQRIQQQNREVWAGNDFHDRIFLYDQMEIDGVAVGNGGLVITDNQGNTAINTEILSILADFPGKAIIIQDKSGDQFVVQKDETTGEVKVTKVEGGGLSPASNTNTTVQADPIKDRIIVLILEEFEEEISAWLRINGKGGEDDPDVLLAEELASCFQKDAGQLKYLKEKTIPYFKAHPAKLRAKIEANQTKKTLFDKIAALFKSEDDVDWTKISADDQDASRNATCEALRDDIAPLVSFYEKAKPMLMQDAYKDAIKKIKAIYEFFKACNNEGWESYNGEGILPYCFWRDQVVSEGLHYSNADLPFTAGLIDGAYKEAEGIYHLPQLAKDLSKIPGKLLYAYTKAYFDCRTSAMMENVKEYEYALAQLGELEDEDGLWVWSKEKYYESKSEAIVEYLKDCKDADQLRETVDQLYEIVTSWEEIKTLYAQVSQQASTYLKTLDKTDNIGRYERGKLVVPVTTTVLTLGAAAAPKIQKLKNVLRSLKETSTENWKKVTEGIGKLIIKEVVTGADDVGKYTTKIRWGIQDVDVRPFNKGYWGRRVPQNDPRVDAFEIKINPNNESFYLAHPEGGYVQYENIVNATVQDGKLVMDQSSIYHVLDKPEFLTIKSVLEPAQRQLAAAKAAGYKVEWLVSDEKAVQQITQYFKDKNIDITVRLFKE